MFKQSIIAIAAAGTLVATPVMAQAVVQPNAERASAESEVGGGIGPAFVIAALAAAGMAILLLTDDDDDDDLPISA